MNTGNWEYKKCSYAGNFIIEPKRNHAGALAGKYYWVVHGGINNSGTF